MSSQIHGVPECIIVEVANYLNPHSVLILGTTCRQLHRCTSSVQVWNWRPLDLRYIKTLAKWNEAFRRGFQSVHRNCTTAVVAPSSKALQVSYEFLSFFRFNLKNLDLTAVHYVAMMDYMKGSFWPWT